MAVISTPARGPYQAWFLGGGADDVGNRRRLAPGDCGWHGILLISRSEDGGPTIQMFLQRDPLHPSVVYDSPQQRVSKYCHPKPSAMLY
jgi:hypothetical protein